MKKRTQEQMEDAAIDEMTQEREAHLFQAGQERAEAQRGQELVSEVATVPRGLDSNLPHADLSAVQEAVIAATAKAASQVNDLRASASGHEQSAHGAGTGVNKIVGARDVTKKQLGKNAIVTSALPGRAYQGRIIGVLGSGPDRSAIQAISDNHAILHDIRDISVQSNLEIGREVNIVTDSEGYSMVQGRSEGKTEKNEKKAELTREGWKR